MNFGEKLYRLRKGKGLSQEALADMLNVSRQAVSRWEGDLSYPETDKIIALSEIYGVTVDSLLKNGEPSYDGQNTVSEPYWISRGIYNQ
jgi:transcriptional regulator with XRE-family HTH domain